MHSIRVLVVEDSSQKLHAVKSKLEEVVEYNLDVDSANRQFCHPT